MTSLRGWIRISCSGCTADSGPAQVRGFLQGVDCAAELSPVAQTWHVKFRQITRATSVQLAQKRPSELESGEPDPSLLICVF